MMRSGLLLLQSVAVLMAAQAVYATSFVERPFPETVKEAPTIVRGKIGMSYADWSVGQDGRKRLYTYYEFQVEELFKGRLPDAQRAMIREMGGEKNGVGLQVSGAAKFQRGEDVVVMLGSPNVDGSLDVRGLMMGKYGIEKDEEGREFLSGAGVSMLTHPAIRGHEHLIGGDKDGHDDTATVKRWTLDALRNLIREQAKSEGSEPPQGGSAAKSPGSSASPVAPGASPQTGDLAAPRLQTSEEGSEASNSSSSWIWAVGFVAALLVGAGILRRRK